MFFPNDTGPQSGYVVFEEGIGYVEIESIVLVSHLSEPRLE